jgi:hypothetical protein
MGSDPPRCRSDCPIEGGNRGWHHPPLPFARVEDAARVIVVDNVGVDR